MIYIFSNKKISIILFAILYSLLLIRAIINLTEDAFASNKGPFAVFYAVHMEAGIRTNYNHQEIYWPRLVNLVVLANKYETKLTLLFNPQWAEYILKDREKYNLVKKWQANGHEIGLHYHLVTHGDWCGYTNRKEFKDAPFYRGTVKEMMRLINKLAAPYKVVSACCGLDIATEVNPAKSGGMTVASRFIDEIDFPDEIIYDIDGFHDGVTKPLSFIFKNKKRYHLRHMPIMTKEGIAEAMKEIEEANPEQIVGIVTHEQDYNPMALKEIFESLSKKGIKIKSVSQIMDSYLKNFREDSFKNF